MPNNHEAGYSSWIKKAEEDELSVGAVLRAGAPSTGCFLAEQMAEKCLKALLVFYRKDFPKVHDLLDLETRLLGVAPEIERFHSDLDFLNRYYIETRYPGDYPEFTKEECEKAFEAALRVKRFVTDKIEQRSGETAS